MCRDEVIHSAEWVLSAELAKENERLKFICIASVIVWIVTVLVLI
jgi:hypothetical protein